MYMDALSSDSHGFKKCKVRQDADIDSHDHIRPQMIISGTRFAGDNERSQTPSITLRQTVESVCRDCYLITSWGILRYTFWSTYMLLHGQPPVLVYYWFVLIRLHTRTRAARPALPPLTRSGLNSAYHLYRPCRASTVHERKEKTATCALTLLAPAEGSGESKSSSEPGLLSASLYILLIPVAKPYTTLPSTLVPLCDCIEVLVSTVP